MKVLILAGGFGTRLSEETEVKPKPMIEIGGKPILWHIMKTYSQYGFNDFVVLLGYSHKKLILVILHGDVTIDLSSGDLEFTLIPGAVEALLDTGLKSMTGSRIKSKNYVGDEDFFYLWRWSS